VDSIGRYGGLVTSWRQRLMRLINFVIFDSSVGIKLYFMELGISITNIYGAYEDEVAY
jgi:hypothetical protein